MLLRSCCLSDNAWRVQEPARGDLLALSHLGAHGFLQVLKQMHTCTPVARLGLARQAALGRLSGDRLYLVVHVRPVLLQIARVIIAGGLLSSTEGLSQATTHTKGRAQAAALAPVK